MNTKSEIADPRFDVIIVGAGPAGMMAAIAAATGGAKVAIVEHLAKPGTKLLATGGGKCNLTNMLDEQSFMARFGRQGRFLAPALAALSREGLQALLGELGVETYVAPEGLKIYPTSNSAATVQQALWQRCLDLDVTPLLGAEVNSVILEPGQYDKQNQVRGVMTSQGELAADAVILATGGKSYPTLGSTGKGYDLARQAGHSIVTPLPALAALITRETWPGRCTGISLPDVRIWIDRKGASKAGVRGELLFTHAGLSGPAVLDISGEISSLLHQPTGRMDVPIRLNLQPELSAANWLARFDQWQHSYGTRAVVTMLAEHLPHSLATVLCELAHIARPVPPPGQRDLTLQPLACAHLDRQARQNLAGLLTAVPLTIRATEGFDKAMVTRGGVKLQEVDPRTLQSKLVEGLYFAGELLDLDGPSGGFNLQAAFSTGFLAGLSAAQKPR